MTLVLLSCLLQIFQCSLSSRPYVKAGGFLSAESFAKLRQIFLPAKLFQTFFVFSFRSAAAPGLPDNLRGSGRGVFLKSECKGRHFNPTRQIFLQVFSTLKGLTNVRECGLALQITQLPRSKKITAAHKFPLRDKTVIALPPETRRRTDHGAMTDRMPD